MFGGVIGVMDNETRDENHNTTRHANRKRKRGFSLIQAQGHRALEGVERIAAERLVHADGDLGAGLIEQDRGAAGVGEQGRAELGRKGQAAFAYMQGVIVQRIRGIAKLAVLVKADDVAAEMPQFLQDKVRTHQAQVHALLLQKSSAHDREFNGCRRPQLQEGAGSQIGIQAVGSIETVAEALCLECSGDLVIKRRDAEKT